MFVAHWVDNAFAGAALEGCARGLHQHLNGSTGSTSDRALPPTGQGEQVNALGPPILNFLSPSSRMM